MVRENRHCCSRAGQAPGHLEKACFLFWMEVVSRIDHIDDMENRYSKFREMTVGRATYQVSERVLTAYQSIAR